MDVLTEEDIENVLNKLYLPIDDTDACFTCGKAIGMHNKFLMPYAPYEVLFSIQSCNPQGYTGLWSEEKFIIVGGDERWILCSVEDCSLYHKNHCEASNHHIYSCIQDKVIDPCNEDFMRSIST